MYESLVEDHVPVLMITKVQPGEKIKMDAKRWPILPGNERLETGNSLF